MSVNEKNIREDIQKDFQNSYLIEAGAGAGKSTLIIERIVNQVIKNKIRLKRIVAITFTKNAGNELEERLRKKLYEIREQIEKSQEQEMIDHINQAISDLDYMEIGTIDSLCNVILREQPFETGFLSMGFRLVDEMENELIIQKNYADQIRHIHTKEGYLDLLKELEYTGSEDSVNKYFALKDIYEQSCRYSLVPLAIDSKSYNYDAIDIFYKYEMNFWDDVVRQLREMLVEHADKKNKEKSIKKNSNFGKILLSHMFDSSKQLTREEYVQLTRKACEDISSNKNPSRSLFKYANKEWSDRIPDIDFNELYQKYIDKQHRVNQLCARLIDDIRNDYIAYKRKNNLLTFEDLLYYTRELLVNNPDVRRKYRDKYQTIFVDEFQDTNPLQTEILFLLMDQNSDNRDWKKSVLKPGALCLVGDPKQSIYRFRNADITLYNEVRQRFTSNMKASNEHQERFISLQWNFRSHESICAYINERFNGEDEVGDDNNPDAFRVGFYKEAQMPHQTVFQGMEAQGLINSEETKQINDGASQKSIEGVYKYTFEADDKIKINDFALQNSENIAKMIQTMVESQVCIREYCNEQIKFRPVKYKDFLIITLRKKNMDLYIRIMDKYGIPSSLSGEKYYYYEDETVNLMELIGFLANPSNSILLVNVLKNIYDINLNDITQDKVILKYVNWRAIKELDENLQKKYGLDAAIEELDKLIKYRNKVNDPKQILEYCINQLIAIYKPRYTELQFQTAYATLVNFVEKVKEEDVSNLYSLYRCIEEKYIEKPVKREASINQDDVVRIMNLHQVKGLEGKIVILAGNQTDRKSNKIYTLVDRKYNDSSRVLVKAGSYLHSDWEQVKSENNLHEKSEEHRLFYVAATRAINALIVSTDEKFKIWETICSQKDTIRNINDSFDEWGIDYQNFEMKEAKAIELSEVKTKEFYPLQDKLKSLSDSSFIDITPSQLEHEYLPESKSSFSLDFAKKEENDDAHGPKWGTLIHRVFELLINSGLENKGKFNVGQSIEKAIREFYRDVYQEKPLLADHLYTDKYTKKMEEIKNDKKLKLTTQNMLINVLREDIEQICNNLLRNELEDINFKQLILASEKVMTELPFSIKVETNSHNPLDQMIIESVNKTLDTIQEKQDITLGYKIKRGEKHIYINGIIDLALKYNDAYHVIDFKTNRIRNGIHGFKKKMQNDYQAQLELYSVIIAKIFEAPVEKIDKYLYLTSIKEFQILI